jgi:hypothetical protein
MYQEEVMVPMAFQNGLKIPAIDENKRQLKSRKGFGKNISN